MPLISINNVSIRYRGPALLDDVTTTIETGQRIGLLGRNGAGKTTLMRMLNGQVEPDSGEILIENGSKISLLQQDVPTGDQRSIGELVATGWIADHRDADDEHSSQWKRQHAVDQILSRMELDAAADFGRLSSGMKRRVLLAKALVSQPDLLLLDEPTNHLDIDAIDWLEKFLAKWPGAIMFVTHDRMFLRRLAQRILEIDRGHIFDWSCDYDTFLKRKQQALSAEEKQNALFDKKLAEEEVWIREGIKARRTRNEGRVRALKALREERAQRVDRQQASRIQIQKGERSGNLVIEAKQITFAYDGDPIIDGFSTTIMRGDKIGVVGPNGVGKTTLLKILLKQLEPQSGTVRHGANLQLAYFDQLRQQLDDEQTVAESVGDGYDYIKFGDGKKHVIGYLQDFLFTPERARSEIRFLSGGERNRILLAKLFAKPANVIILDEPTNDLDVETLEMLEERLVEYQGTLMIVSHDREFLNNVVTSTIVFENESVKEYVGGYDDWLRQRPELQPTETPGKQNTRRFEKPGAVEQRAASPRKLKFKEQKELAELPQQIDVLENQIEELHALMADHGFYQQDGTLIAEKQVQLKSLEQQLAAAYARWEELESVE